MSSSSVLRLPCLQFIAEHSSSKSRANAQARSGSAVWFDAETYDLGSLPATYADDPECWRFR